MTDGLTAKTKVAILRKEMASISTTKKARDAAKKMAKRMGLTAGVLTHYVIDQLNKNGSVSIVEIEMISRGEME